MRTNILAKIVGQGRSEKSSSSVSSEKHTKCDGVSNLKSALMSVFIQKSLLAIPKFDTVVNEGKSILHFQSQEQFPPYPS